MTVRLLFAILGIITIAMFTTAWYMYVPVNAPQTLKPAVVSTTQTTVLAQLTQVNPGEYWLSLKVTIPAGYHIYSIYQEANGPPASTIDIDPNTVATVQSEWIETPNPTVKRSDIWPGVKMLQLEGTVDWTITIRSFNPDFKPTVSGVIKVYPCGETSCLMPQEIRFTTN
jgi:hypothetical protein